jgi:AcrR family transcriptional regulator
VAEPLNMRERTRRIVQSELTQIAQDLFLQHGYEATTVDDIASAAGMSKRTFFRYFASKEDLVIGKYELFGERMADALRDRPAEEPLWTSLRRVFDLTEVYFRDGPERERNSAMESIVRSTPGLYAAYLERLAAAQALVAEVAAERLPRPGRSAKQQENAVLRAPVIVGAAFACANAASRQWHESGGTRPFAELLDAAMALLPFET